jgi:hypothetical protein
MDQNRAMGPETIIFYEMPLWERGGLVAMGLAAIALGLTIWRAESKGELVDPPGAKPTPQSQALRGMRYGSLFGVRGFAAVVATFGAVLMGLAMLGVEISWRGDALRCGIPGRAILPAQFDDVREITVVERGRQGEFQGTRAQLRFASGAGATESCALFDHLDDDSRARLLALVRERIAARPRN